MNIRQGDRMYVEEQYIREEFNKNFILGIPGNIVIYGTGIHTQKLLKAVKTDRIVGLMDIQKTGEVILGKKVLSYEEVARIKDVYIVIIARNAVINIIYRRIKEFVSKNGIDVYDINGSNLCREFADLKREHECFSLNVSDLKKKISNADVVSFDIFDTLLTRQVLRPRNIFDVMNQILANKSYVFSSERIKAEDNFPIGSNPTIYQIYGRLKENLNLSDAEAEELLQLELEIEKKYLVRREVMCNILEEAADQGKRIFLVSDMYMPSGILRNLLSEFNITRFEDLLVSCEYGKIKEEGLFKELILKKELDGKTVLHIGDNLFADVLSAEKSGIMPYKVYGPVEMLENSIYSDTLTRSLSLEENIVIASFASNAYNNPFGEYQKNGKLFLNDKKKVIDLFISPVIWKYSIWLIQQLKIREIDYIIFPSRDGFVLKKIYDEIRNSQRTLDLPDSHYLYASRRLTLTAASQTVEDVKNVLRFEGAGSDKDKLKERFETVCNSMTENVPEEVFEEALKEAAKEKENYVKYLQKNDLYKNKRIGFVDFVAMGTIQEALQRITGKKLYGFYFLRRSANESSKRELECDSLYKMNGDFQLEANIYRFYYFLETLLTSYEPTVRYMDANGKPVFYEEKRDENTLNMLQCVHSYVIEYCRKMQELCPDIIKWNSGVEIYDELLGFFSLDYADIEDMEICHLKNIDEFMGRCVTEINR